MGMSRFSHMQMKIGLLNDWAPVIVSKCIRETASFITLKTYFQAALRKRQGTKKVKNHTQKSQKDVFTASNIALCSTAHEHLHIII